MYLTIFLNWCKKYSNCSLSQFVFFQLTFFDKILDTMREKATYHSMPSIGAEGRSSCILRHLSKKEIQKLNLVEKNKDIQKENGNNVTDSDVTKQWLFFSLKMEWKKNTRSDFGAPTFNLLYQFYKLGNDHPLKATSYEHVSWWLLGTSKTIVQGMAFQPSATCCSLLAADAGRDSSTEDNFLRCSFGGIYPLRWEARLRFCCGFLGSKIQKKEL